jgi:hypothetical protein
MGNGLPLSGGNYSTGQLLVHPSPDAPSFFSVYEGHAHSNPSEKVSIFKSDPSAMPSTPRMFSFALEVRNSEQINFVHILLLFLPHAFFSTPRNLGHLFPLETYHLMVCFEFMMRRTIQAV